MEQLKKDVKAILEQWSNGDLSDGEALDAVTNIRNFRNAYSELRDLVLSQESSNTDLQMIEVLIEVFWNGAESTIK